MANNTGIKYGFTELLEEVSTLFLKPRYALVITYSHSFAAQ